MLQRYPLHDLLAARKPALGLILNFAAPAMVDIAGLMGFDFVVLDAEHGPMSPARSEAMIRSAELGRIAPIVRVASKKSEDILRYLDLGATGIVFPNIETAEDADEAVATVRFPPLGRRGLAPNTNASGFGLHMPYDGYLKLADELVLALMLIESGKGVDNIDEILNVDGISAVVVGAMDLSATLGTPGNPASPEVRGAIDHIVARCRERGMPFVLSAGSESQGRENIARGAAMLLTPVAGLLANLGRPFTRALR